MMAPRNPTAPFPDDVPTANLSIIDFDLLRNGDKTEAQNLYAASQGCGFFYVKNHHIDSDFMLDLANETYALPIEEKMKYDMGTTGSYFGYKRSGASYVDEKGTPDQIESYNISKDDILRVGNSAPLLQPEPINKRRRELDSFMRSSHAVAMTVLRTLGGRLGLDPDLLPSLHRINRTGGDQARVTHTPPANGSVVALGEHTDFGSVTVLFNHMGGLQVLNPDSKEWKYVKPEPGCAVINLGDAIVKLVNSKLHSGLHRVVSPPGEQAKLPRHSVVYFSRPNGDVVLRPLFNGILQEGVEEPEEQWMTADEWIVHRAVLRNMAAYTGPETFHASQGTEHTKRNREITV